MTKIREEAEVELAKRIGYRFKDHQLFRQALTHASGTKATAPDNNERLEFLGDRVLGLVVAELLYERHDKLAEGELARMLNALVKRQTCAKIGRELEIGDALILAGKGRKRTVVTDNIIGDACEALIAAIYLDGGLAAAREFIALHWSQLLEQVPDMRKDAKSALQEWAAAKSLDMPSYEIVETSGPDHAPEFLVELTVHGKNPARGVAGTRRMGEQAAAAEFLRREGIWK